MQQAETTTTTQPHPWMFTLDRVGRRSYIVYHGSTYPWRAALKSAKCAWDAKRNQWYIGSAEKAEELITALNALLSEARAEEGLDTSPTPPTPPPPKTKYYLDGHTYPHREALKAAGFAWDADRKEWYTHDPACHTAWQERLTGALKYTCWECGGPSRWPADMGRTCGRC